MRVQPVSSLSERGAPGESPGVPLISVVVPVYKEERNIVPFLERMIPVVEKLGPYEILFCLDPSPDGTEAVILREAEKNPRIGLLVFSRRFGQPAATMAGILNCRGDWCVVIDVDLQDPPEVIAELMAKAREGYEVVSARRSSRQGETLVKRVVSTLGYKLINRIAEVQIPADTGDFRVMSRRVVEELRRLSEAHGFLRGLVSYVGFRQGEVLYERQSRHSGAGNYNRLLGSLKIGFNGIFGFSTAPLQLMMWTGFLLAALSALAVIVVVALKILEGDAYPMGIPTITILVLFIGGVQLAAVGVLGEYIGRIYEEVRERPLYIVDRVANATVREARGPGDRRRRGGTPGVAPGLPERNNESARRY
ncbi:glycosyltransferase family 2 protein [soil metagenome]